MNYLWSLKRAARANKAFIELNCANLPEHLLESELFVTAEAHSPERTMIGKAYLRKLREGYSFLMKSVTLHCQYRLGF